MRKKNLSDFSDIKYQLWSPSVSKIYIDFLGIKRGLELVINQDYSRCINKLRDSAKRSTKNTGNPAYRVLQILEHMRGKKFGPFRKLDEDFMQELQEGKLRPILEFERKHRKSFMVEIRNNFLDLYFL